MTDEQFRTELRIRAYVDQISGYPFGHPKREHFTPIVPVVNYGSGKIDREATLRLVSYHKFTDEDRVQLLK
jgi:hypothetical protein